ncbi:hypothetical protein D9757_004211 [Collybiopsis confluens]|uniref:NADH:flavin oxidoreductase/NADH oxidase N-terminal domain-containing protein n=1 Tax=Collybiopsis confluens TaxID=2823264 RepID=A0A8H5MCQ1_9AGAR|nr:hypothetical protein D9757_004211 [Collybiopsis confluens]
MESIFDEQSLPCGRTVPNRLVKVAMYEHLASIFGGPPNDYHLALYSAWSEHNWGMIITGNVAVSPSHLTLGRDMVAPSVLKDSTVAPFAKLAGAIHANSSKCLAIMQLSHAGRQSSNFLGGRRPFASPLGPSALRFGPSDLFHRLLFQTPKAMSISDIDTVISDFVRGALLAVQSGFDGVQFHAAHGCKFSFHIKLFWLILPFLFLVADPGLRYFLQANIRTDDYSLKSLLLLKRIINGIREVVPQEFILGIKFNTTDYSILDKTRAKKDQEARALAHLHEIISWNVVDFIEISGGNYENTEFMLSATAVSSSNPRQAFFAHFSSKLKAELLKLPPSSHRLPLILLTGGLRSPAHLHAALSAKHTDLLGLGRTSVVAPNLPNILNEHIQSRKRGEAILSMGDDDLEPFKPEPHFSLPAFTKCWPWSLLWEYVPKASLIGAGTRMAWYIVVMRRLAEERMDLGRTKAPSDYSMGGLGAVFWMWIWFSPGLQYSGKFWILLMSIAMLVLFYGVL